MRRFVRQDATGDHLQFVVPRSMRSEILQQVHNSLLGGHLGQKKTREKVLQRFCWSGVCEDCNIWIAKCDECAKVKHPPRRPRAPLGEMLVGAPLDRLASNILGPFPESAKGNKYILAMTDYFTKWVEIYAIPDQSAITCAEVILDEFIGQYGCPYNIHSDQGRNYENTVFTELCRLLEIQKTQTSPYNPHCNGQVERFNQTLVSMIKSFLKGKQREWDRNLGSLAGTYCATVHESTGMTPNLLMFGKENQLPIEVILGTGKTSTGEEITSYGEYVDGLRDCIQKAHDVARKYLGKNAVRVKESYDTKRNLTHYKPGDLVWYANTGSQLDLAPKLRVPFQGPYLVLAKIGDLDYKIQLDAKGKQKVVHHNKLKPYEGVHNLPWAKSALKAHAKQTKNVSGTRRTPEVDCDLASQPSTKTQLVRFSSDVEQFTSSQISGTQVRDCDLVSQSSVTSQ